MLYATGNWKRVFTNEFRWVIIGTATNPAYFGMCYSCVYLKFTMLVVSIKDYTYIWCPMRKIRNIQGLR